MRLAKRTILLAVAGSSALALSATPASAAATLGSTACSTSNITALGGGSVTDCRGWYEGNLNSGNATVLADTALILNSLLGVSTYTAANLVFTDLGFAGNTINFGSTLNGTSVLGIHVGASTGGGGISYNGTAFFELLGPVTGATVNVGGLSNARLFAVTAVPEAGTWAMMLLGIGGIAFAMRRGKKVANTTVTYKGMPRLA